MLYDPKWEVPAEIKEEVWRTVLRDAAQLLKERGWARHRMVDDCGRMCMMGAIIETTDSGRMHESVTAIEKLEKALVLPIPVWNDMPTRTKEQVIAKLLEVAGSE